MDAMSSVAGILLLLSPVFCQLADMDVACGTSRPLKLEEAQGDLYSPGFQENKNYPPDTKCSFYLEMPQSSKKILLEIKFLDIEASSSCVNDFLQISDRYEFIIYGKFCGSNITEKMLISTTYLMITFKSDFIVSGRGFHLSYQVTNQTSLCANKLKCKNNNCVPSSAICNQKDDCGDGTDEEDCSERKSQRAECGNPKIPPLLDNSFDRIVGGQEVVPGSWPWQADLQLAIYHPNGHLCGGALINSEWVVTAAHCVSGSLRAEDLRIHLGNHNKYFRDPNEQIRYGKYVQKYDDRSDYSITSKGDDIALIRLNAEVDFSSHVSPVCLPPAGLELKEGTKCSTTGWGLSRGSGTSAVLKQVLTKVTSASACENPMNIYFKFNQTSMLCIDSYDNDGNMCYGDSGGPLVCQVENKWYLFGVTSAFTELSSFGAICGVENVPSIFTKVSAKIDWIQHVVKTHG